MPTEQEIAERLDWLEQPYRAMSKAVAEGVLAALKESGQTIAAQSVPNAITEQPPILNEQSIEAASDALRQSLPEIPGVCAVLGALPKEAIINEVALAKMFGKCTASIKAAVERRELPPPIRFMGKPTWTAGAIIKHFEKRLEAAAKKDEQWRR